MLRKILITSFIFAFVAMLAPVEPAEAITNLNAYPEQVYYWDSTAYISETGDSQTDAPGDIFLGRDASPKNNTLYITMGQLDTLYTYFDELYINVTTPGDMGAVTWQYYSDGSGWIDLAVTDETDGFKNSGWGKVSWEIPSDWIGSNVNGKSGRWIRARTTTSYYTQPLAGQIEVRAYNLRLKVEDEEGSPITGLTVDNFSLSDCDDTTVYGVREMTGGIYELALQTRVTDTYCLIGVNKSGYSSFTKLGFGEVNNYVKDVTYSPFVLEKIAGVSAIESSAGKNKSEVEPDGIDFVTISVSLKDAARDPVGGVSITLESSRSEDVITPESVVADSDGYATFQVSSEVVGQSIFTVTADGVVLDRTVEVDFGHFGPEVGSLIKLADDGDPSTQFDSAIYYYTFQYGDYVRYAFPNSQVYFSWYDDFSDVQTISFDEMGDIRLRGNVTYRPGTRMIKIQSDPKTYAVTEGGVLRWVQTEELAIALYGSDWNTKIDDIDVAFWVNYTFGDDITDVSDFDPAAATAATATINKNLGL